MFSDKIFVSLLVFCGCLVFMNILQGQRLLRYLRAHHRHVSDRVDQTAFGEGPDAPQITALAKFVSGKQYLKLQDPILNRLCRTSQAIYSATLVAILFLMLFFLAKWGA
jgi:hypothetical protein